ncbi:cytochrome c4 [Kineobactrum sediminis]|uniref:Cytochrome c4 n=1 Tax=Kineobactrum sediminis TaxID=1905677 RepID=A0A2N5Y1Z1_9GAMM|nr:c-type cytochrome [Kineobactrum sediminis]PLW82415.1 cytochrome c4 [Kineobactrum sediminis]
MKKRIVVLGIALVAALASGISVAETPDQAQVCVACHGEGGKSTNPLWPNLAGQNAGYLARQITAFREGERKNPAMAPFVAPLTDADIAILASYFSSQPLAISATGDASEIETGKYLAGYCSACHGYAGKPATNEWPILAGQHAAYLRQQLLAYKSGERIHPLMQAAISKLGEKEFSALAAYYSQLQP